MLDYTLHEMQKHIIQLSLYKVENFPTKKFALSTLHKTLSKKICVVVTKVFPKKSWDFFL